MQSVIQGKKILPLLPRISIVTLSHKGLSPINSSFLCRSVLESSTQIQDRYPRLSLADLFKKFLQINASQVEDSSSNYNSR